MRGKSEGGSRNRGKLEQDEEYSEEEDESSSASVGNSGDEDEEEEESDEEEEEEEKVNVRRPGRPKVDPQSKGRFTRQKAREEMPTKRLLRSRKKSPGRGAGFRVPQVFKCPNCKKEFNNKVSLNRHGGWCKQKSTKSGSPRKKREDGSKKTHKKEVDVHSAHGVDMMRREVDGSPHDSSPGGSGGRGKGGLKKNAPLEPEFNDSVAINNFHNAEQLIFQQRYQEDEMITHEQLIPHPHRPSVEQDFMQQRSPQSSPGMMDTSSEEDYEQKEFAANAHQLISHRSNSNASIDVVNTELPSEISEGPVTCPQCKMTYRTLQGFQNHFPGCTGFSSDDDSEEEEGLGEEGQQLVHSNGSHWGASETMSETVIGPPHPYEEPAIVEETEPEPTPEAVADVPSESIVEPQQRQYQEISILSGKSPIKIILPPDNTPQVINAAGLTLERLEASPVPKAGGSHSQLASPARKPGTPNITDLHVQNSHVMPSPTQRIASSHIPNYSQNAFPQVIPNPAVPPSMHCHIHSGASLSSHLTPASATTTIMSTSITGSTTASIPVIPQAGNPPTYTQAQLMPGTVLHNSMMPTPIPQQMATTSMSEQPRHHVHQIQPVTTQTLQPFPGAHFPSYTQAPSLPPQPQPVYRVQNGIPSLSHGLGQTHPALYPGQSTVDTNQQIPVPPGVISNTQRLPTPGTQQLAQFPPQMPGAPVAPGQPIGQQILQGTMGGHQQPLMYANGQYVMPQNQNPLPQDPSGLQQMQQYPMMQANAHPQSFQQMPTSSPAAQLQNPQTALAMQQGLFQAQQQTTTPALPNGNVQNQTDHTTQQQFSNVQHTYSPYFQNPMQNFPRLAMDPAAQQQFANVMQQQTMFQNTSNPTFQQVGGLQLQMQQMLQSHHNNGMQFSNPQAMSQTQLTQSVFPSAAQPQNPAQISLPQGMQPVGSQMHAQQNSLPTNPVGSMPSVQPGTAPAPMQNVQQTNSPQLSTTVELNSQQQAQLQQQQQQFLALQQQQQQLQMQQANNDISKPQLQQMPSHNLQAVMINNTLQWIRTPQPIQQQLQSQPVQQPQQQTESARAPPTPQQPSQPATAPVPQSQPQQVPQVIQQLAHVTDSAGNTYLIMLPAQQQQQSVSQNSSQTGNAAENTAAHILNLVSGLQAQTQRANHVPGQCVAAAAGHSPGSSSGSFHSVGKSSPCPCAACKEKTGTANVMEKFKKVLPHPSPNDNSQPHLKPIVPNIAPKPIAVRPAISKPLVVPKVVRVQAATTRPAIQLAFAHPGQLHNPNPQHPQLIPGSQLKLMPIQHPPQGVVGAPAAANANVPISSPNIAVVRPMENPLQKLSDQISQIESTFMAPSLTSQQQQTIQQASHQSSTTAIVSQTSPPPGHHITLVSTSPPPPTSATITFQIPGASTSPAQLISTHVITLDPPLADEDPIGHAAIVETQPPIELIPEPRLGLVDHGVIVANECQVAPPSPQVSSPGSSIQSISNPNTPVRNGVSVPSEAAGVKRKILQVSPSSSGGTGPAAKSIRLTLHKMGDGDSYSIKKIERGAAKASGSYKSLKIKGRILSSRLSNGPQEGTATNVVIVPCIRIVPNPDPDTNDGNVTIAEDDNSNVENIDTSGHRGGDNNNNGRSNLRLTHRAVIVYEGRMESNNKVLFQSSDVLDVWDRVFQIVQGTRLNHNLPPISYPATNIALPQNEVEAQAVFSKLGLTHRALNFLLQKLPGLEALSKAQQNQQERKPPSQVPSPAASDVDTQSNATTINCSSPQEHKNEIKSEDEDDNEDIIEYNESGSARLEKFRGRKPFDMFGWLTSKHRNQVIDSNRSTSVILRQEQSEQCLKFLSAPLGMRYRKMKETWREYLVTKKSDVQGIGLFTMRDIEKGEMIIEYAGEVIRPLVCDIREKYYESKAIGCYMFRINDHVIDATMKGNAARFINHSCEPNCEARTVKISGKDHIIIFSLQRIPRGNELTYDYKFEKEEEKIPCLCKSKNCRKYLN